MPAELDDATMQLVDRWLLQTRVNLFEAMIALPLWRRSQRQSYAGGIALIDALRRALRAEVWGPDD